MKMRAQNLFSSSNSRPPTTIKITKAIEFETFRKTFTYEEAEEIRADFEKVVASYDRILPHDWFGAQNQKRAKECVDTCRTMRDEFEPNVFKRQERLGGGATNQVRLRAAALEWLSDPNRAGDGRQLALAGFRLLDHASGHVKSVSAAIPY